jgi:hypothetical protein
VVNDALDKLASVNPSPELPWCCRWSSTGRGLRLHQIPSRDALAFNVKVYDTPREALDAFLLEYHRE